MIKADEKLELGQKIYAIRSSQTKVGYRIYIVEDIENISTYPKPYSYRYGFRDLNRRSEKIFYMTFNTDMENLYTNKVDLFKYYHNIITANKNAKVPEQIKREIKAHIKKFPEYWV